MEARNEKYFDFYHQLARMFAGSDKRFPPIEPDYLEVLLEIDLRYYSILSGDRAYLGRIMGITTHVDPSREDEIPSKEEWLIDTIHDKLKSLAVDKMFELMEYLVDRSRFEQYLYDRKKYPRARTQKLITPTIPQAC